MLYLHGSNGVTPEAVWHTIAKYEQAEMKCSIQGCPGECERKLIVHTVKRADDVFVFENVPADVCNICSDTLLAPETVRHLEKMIRAKAKPGKLVPLYEYG